MAYFSRGKNKVQNPYTIKDFYSQYITENEYIDYNIYKKILVSYFKKISNILYEDSLIYYIPNSLGMFQITKKQRNIDTCLFHNSQIDWENTIKYGKKIYHVNEHSDGYRYYFKWFKKGMLRNINCYRFIPTRENKRKLAYYIKNRIRDYFEVK